MTSEAKQEVRALGLCSGGLDSILSALVLKEQGVCVEWVVFTTPFFSADNAKHASRLTGVPLTCADITDEYVKMLIHPPFGYGQNMNPCPDCHSMMFSAAGRMMKEKRFDFLFSGEVLGQRPMSQNKSSLRYVEKHSDFDGYILRPLSAKKLPVTIVEEKGLVDREKLLDLSGRSRKPQMKLAEKYGVKDYPAPAGGCLLTDKVYSERLFDYLTHLPSFLKAHEGNNGAVHRKLPCKKDDPGIASCNLSVVNTSEIHHSDLYLLKSGRHFRLNDRVKVICGRNKADNEYLQKHMDSDKDILLKPLGFPGPLAVITGDAKEKDIAFCARIVAGYGKLGESDEGNVLVTDKNKKKAITVKKISPKDMKEYLV